MTPDATQTVTATIEMTITRADGTIEVIPAVPMTAVELEED